jgi:hypothetical protein
MGSGQKKRENSYSQRSTSGVAASGDGKLLVFVDAVRIADRRIGCCQARPGGGAAEANFGQIPQGIAPVNDNGLVDLASSLPS